MADDQVTPEERKRLRDYWRAKVAKLPPMTAQQVARIRDIIAANRPRR